MTATNGKVKDFTAVAVATREVLNVLRRSTAMTEAGDEKSGEALSLRRTGNLRQVPQEALGEASIHFRLQRGDRHDIALERSPSSPDRKRTDGD